jgi:hypothetical protein
MTDSGIQDLVQALTQNTKFEASWRHRYHLKRMTLGT